jgi:hypothetical protein
MRAAKREGHIGKGFWWRGCVQRALAAWPLPSRSPAGDRLHLGS